MSYVVPTDTLTLTDIKTFEMKAREAGIVMALGLKIATSREGLRARHAQNIADFGQAALNDFWQTAPLLAVGTAYSCFGAVAAPALANNRVAVFYKVGVETAPLPVSLLAFREGAAGNTTYAVFDLEQLVNKLAVDGYFTEPVVYGPTRVMNITATARIATGLLARVQLGCFIIEPAGPVLS